MPTSSSTECSSASVAGGSVVGAWVCVFVACMCVRVLECLPTSGSGFFIVKHCTSAPKIDLMFPTSDCACTERNPTANTNRESSHESDVHYLAGLHCAARPWQRHLRQINDEAASKQASKHVNAHAAALHCLQGEHRRGEYEERQCDCEEQRDVA